MKRSAYTLIELCVVMILAVTVAGIAATVLPGIFRSDHVTSAASQLQGWLLEAKMRAMRDQIPTGIRIFGGSYPNNALANQFQLVQMPEQWAMPGTLDCQQIFDATGTVLLEVRCTAGGGLDLTGGLPQQDWPVQPGDYVKFFGCGAPHQIVNVTPTYFDLYSSNIGKTFPSGVSNDPYFPLTSQFEFVRKPRPATGEGTRLLAKGAVVDVGLGQSYGASLPPGNSPFTWDLLFSPAGTLMQVPGGSQGRVLLWVREDDADKQGNTFTGYHLIVTVTPSTGAIAVNGLNPNGAGSNYVDPFALSRDPHGSGF